MEQLGNITLHRGDCMEVLRELPDGSHEILLQAKAVEREIDDEIARVQKVLAFKEQQQPNLFNR